MEHTSRKNASVNIIITTLILKESFDVYVKILYIKTISAILRIYENKI